MEEPRNDTDALVNAALSGDTAAVENLLKQGVNPNNTDSDGDFPLMRVIGSGRDEAVPLLIQYGADVNAQDSEGDTALIYAASRGATETVRLLIAKGAEIDHRNIQSENALYWSGVNGHPQTEELIRYAMSLKADPHEQLFAAVRNNSLNAAREAVKDGADVNHHDETGATPLIIAAIYNRKEIIKLLLDHDAEIEVTDKNGISAISAATTNKFTETLQLLKNTAIARQRAHLLMLQGHLKEKAHAKRMVP